MELEKQVCNLRLAKHLDQLGAKQNSHFVWWYTEAMSTDVKYFPEIDWEKREWTLRPRTSNMQDSGRDVAAFTVSELGEMLPPYFCSVDAGATYKWTCRKWSHGTLNTKVPIQYADTEANARAKMLVYLLEQGLVAGAAK